MSGGGGGRGAARHGGSGRPRPAARHAGAANVFRAKTPRMRPAAARARPFAPPLLRGRGVARVTGNCWGWGGRGGGQALRRASVATERAGPGLREAAAARPRGGSERPAGRRRGGLSSAARLGRGGGGGDAARGLRGAGGLPVMGGAESGR